MSKSARAAMIGLVVLYFVSTAVLYGRLSDTNGALARTQQALEKTTSDSANTRITTVTQRCKFTALVTNVLVKQDPQVAGPFKKSLAGCMKQLAVVKQIAASAPTSTK